MGLIERRTDPTPRELRWFGVMIWPLFVLVAALLWFRAGAHTAAVVLLSLSSAVTVAYSLLPPLRRPLFVAWMTIFYPVGWVISHLLLVVVYYLVVTPIGLALRLTGRDSMQRRPAPGSSTDWVTRTEKAGPSRYFRQF